VQQGAAIDTWGVGTKLVTAYDEPALGGVYKLSMIKPHAASEFVPRIKLSEQAAKISNPGVLQVRRFQRAGRFIADVIYDEQRGCSPWEMIDPLDPTRERKLDTDLQSEDLLVPVWQRGQRTAAEPSLHEIRARVRAQLAQLDPTVRRLLNPHEYPVGLCASLYRERMRLMQVARKGKRTV
jgi:nicotinate phosphoribosyltransferase